MSGSVFVSGMLRSGTSLAQTLLTNHPDVLIAYQPFHQLYVEVKQLFLDEHGIEAPVPLDDGAPGNQERRDRFLSWLASRRFSVDETRRLVDVATRGKGGGLADMPPPRVEAGLAFAELHRAMHTGMARWLGREDARIVGSKEILCEEYVPALLASGTRCVLIVRDPRAVIASANNGRYRDMVGDRYPLMMLIRLWRKTAAYWLRYRHHPAVRSIRYEDLIASPEAVLDDLAGWLGVEPFPPDIARRPLQDHAGNPWHGNSSFGDKPAVDPNSRETWRSLIAEDELRFISACTRHELEAIGYPVPPDLTGRDVTGFSETSAGVRPSYLAWHALDEDVRAREAARLMLSPGDASPEQLASHFLFPDNFGPTSGSARA